MLVIAVIIMFYSVVQSNPLYQRSDPGTAPPKPSGWPSVSPGSAISDELLNDRLVTDALAFVQKTVPASLLQIPPSTYISGSTVTYNGNADANCYWPSSQCIRRADGVGYIADVYTCNGGWGLTYDDGPTQNIVNGVHVADTAAIRNELNAMGITATFFVTGMNAIKYPEEIILNDKSGHQIASHTWSHYPLTSLSNAQVVAELKYTEALIYQHIGKVPTYLRPPYGDVDDRVRAIANALGYRIAFWDRDSYDAADPPTDQSVVLNTITSWFDSTAGFASLQHDITTTTSQTAIDALKAIQSKGPAFKLKIQAMASCNSHPFYSNSKKTINTTITASRTMTTHLTTELKPSIVAAVSVTPDIKPESKVGSGAGYTLAKGLLEKSMILIALMMIFIV